MVAACLLTSKRVLWLITLRSSIGLRSVEILSWLTPSLTKCLPPLQIMREQIWWGWRSCHCCWCLCWFCRCCYHHHNSSRFFCRLWHFRRGRENYKKETFGEKRVKAIAIRNALMLPTPSNAKMIEVIISQMTFISIVSLLCHSFWLVCKWQ